MDNTDIKNKVVIITGAGSGIGEHAAAAFVREGAKVVMNGRSESKLNAVQKKIDPTGESTRLSAGNICETSVCNELTRLAMDEFGSVDILLNNAGVFEPKSFLDHSEQDIDSYLSLLKAYFVMSQNAVREMVKSESGGSIINIGSMWALHAIEATPCSGSSTAKGGVHSLTKNLAIELAKQKIRVNCIAPAVVEPPLFDPLLSPEQLNSFNSFHPIGRNGTPEDVVNTILFLASEKLSGWMTGNVLPLDGGVTSGRST